MNDFFSLRIARHDSLTQCITLHATISSVLSPLVDCETEPNFRFTLEPRIELLLMSRSQGGSCQSAIVLNSKSKFGVSVVPTDQYKCMLHDNHNTYNFVYMPDCMSTGLCCD